LFPTTELYSSNTTPSLFTTTSSVASKSITPPSLPPSPFTLQSTGDNRPQSTAKNSYAFRKTDSSKDAENVSSPLMNRNSRKNGNTATKNKTLSLSSPGSYTQTQTHSPSPLRVPLSDRSPNRGNGVSTYNTSTSLFKSATKSATKSTTKSTTKMAISGLLGSKDATNAIMSPVPFNIAATAVSPVPFFISPRAVKQLSADKRKSTEKAQTQMEAIANAISSPVAQQQQQEQQHEEVLRFLL
jgi:hypothetical protein